MSQDLYDVIALCVARVEHDGDPEPLFHPYIEDAADELTGLAGDDLRIWALLGKWHWLRARAAPDPTDSDDLRASMEAYLRLYQEIPQPIQRAIAQVTGTEPDTAAMYRLALETFRNATPARDLAMLDEAIELLEAVVRNSGRERWSPLSDLGAALLARSEWTGQAADLTAAITHLKAALATAPEDHPGRGRPASNLALALEQTDLDEAIVLHRAAVAATPPEHESRDAFLYNLHAALVMRFRKANSRTDLDEAITVGQAAVAATGDDHPNRVARLAELGVAFLMRGDPPDANAGIQWLRAAAEATPESSSQRGRILTDLANALRARFERNGDSADLDEAIDRHRAAVPVAEHDRRPRYRANLGTALLSRFDQARNPDDLAEAITHLRAGTDLDPYHLGIALLLRFEHLGNLSDLDEAITYLKAAAAQEHSNRGTVLSGLSSALRQRFERTGHLPDLDASITTGEAAVTAAPPGRAGRHRSLSSLGNALIIRFDHTQNGADINRAIEQHQAALRSVPDGDPQRVAYISNLGNAFWARGQWRDSLDDLDQAIEYLRTVAASPSHWTTGPVLSNLANASWARYELSKQDSDRDHAVEYFRKVAELETATPSLRCRSAQQLATAEGMRQKWTEAADAYELALELLPQVSNQTLARDDQEHVLADHAGWASHAAAVAVHLGENVRALGFLEQGRGVLLAQALESRTDLTKLHSRHPALAAELSEVLTDLDQEHRSGTSDETARRHRLHGRRTRLLTDIRALPEFQTFMLPPDVTEIAEAAAGGHVVVVNCSGFRFDALIITPGRDDLVRLVELPRLTSDIATERSEKFIRAIMAADNTGLRDGLGWLWDAIVEPILTALEYTAQPGKDPEQLPRLWWMPTGPFTWLPLHAAGHYPTADEKQQGARSCSALDFAVSSYTPTLRALHEARTRHTTSGHRSVVVGMEQTPRPDDSYADLVCAAEEAELVRGHLGSPTPPLLNTSATRETVREELRHSSWAHFACHASAVAGDPSASHLALHDGDLSVVDISRLRLADARLAYLSACQTAQPGTTLPDEALHISGAFHLAGFPHVIGTLWAIGDQLAKRIATSFYTHLRGDPAKAAYALHKAVTAIRAEHETVPLAWAAHIHTGP